MTTRTKPKPIPVGEYCLATKYSDGEGWDGWAVGFYVGEVLPGRHQVVDKDGNVFRANGFRRCEPITQEHGNYLLAYRSEIERTGVRLWDYVRRPINDDGTAGEPI